MEFRLPQTHNPLPPWSLKSVIVIVAIHKIHTTQAKMHLVHSKSFHLQSSSSPPSPPQRLRRRRFLWNNTSQLINTGIFYILLLNVSLCVSIKHSERANLWGSCSSIASFIKSNEITITDIPSQPLRGEILVSFFFLSSFFYFIFHSFFTVVFLFSFIFLFILTYFSLLFSFIAYSFAFFKHKTGSHLSICCCRTNNTPMLLQHYSAVYKNVCKSSSSGGGGRQRWDKNERNLKVVFFVVGFLNKTSIKKLKKKWMSGSATAQHGSAVQHSYLHTYNKHTLFNNNCTIPHTMNSIQRHYLFHAAKLFKVK